MNQTPKRSGQSQASAMRELAPYMSLGTQLTITVLLMWGIGRWIDSSYNTTPWWTAAMLVVGSIVGLTNFIRSVLRLTKRSSAKPQAHASEKKDMTKASANNNDVKG